MRYGLTREELVFVIVISLLILVSLPFLAYQFMRLVRDFVGRSLTFKEVLAACDDGLSVINYQNPKPHLQVFSFHGSHVHIEYARIDHGSDLVEVINARWSFSKEMLRVDFHNSSISRLKDFISTPENRPINCSAMYELRTVAEKTAQEYLRLSQSESSS